MKVIAQRPIGLDELRAKDDPAQVLEIAFKEIFDANQNNIISRILKFHIANQKDNVPVWMSLSCLNVNPTLLNDGTFKL
jgi:hypothetical protein